MLAAGRTRLLPPIPPAVRYVLAGCLVALVAYALWMVEAAPTVTAPGEQPTEMVVSVPQLDATILAGARDGTREERLRLEVEPLRHLLAKAIDVGPTVAATLGMTDAPVPVADVRAQPLRFRHQWLWYEGVLESLASASDGHPIQGYSIHEATVRLADGERVLAAFSLPPGPDIETGVWVRVEGYFLKLRDLSYPKAIESAPMLVGRQIQFDYEDWGPVTQLDPGLLARLDDRGVFPGDLALRTLEEDQSEALWHLAAYARDTATTRTLADWRRVPVLHFSWHQKVMDSEVPRATQMRVFGTLIRRTTLAAPTNPAGIRAWTTVWIQVREYGGKLVPVWVPKRVAELPPRAPLEVRGFYYRRFAYDTEAGRRVTPLFVAADLDRYELGVDKTMREIGLWIAGVVAVLFALLLWSQRRAARASVLHRRDMDARRRRLRERQAATPPPLPPVP